MCKACGCDLMIEAPQERPDKQAQVDHIERAQNKEDILCEMSGLQTLCLSCHSLKTKLEEKGAVTIEALREALRLSGKRVATKSQIASWIEAQYAAEEMMERRNHGR